MSLQPPSDAEIRPALKKWLGACFAGEDSVIVEELGICRGQVRVDLAVVNGTLHGYEIKSDRDSLARLGRQVEIYGKVLDWATLVVGRAHTADAMLMVPSWWGIVRVEAGPGGPALDVIRSGHRNPGRDPRALAELLWHADALALLEQRHRALGVRSKPRRVVWDRLCQHMETEEIACAVRSRLKARARHGYPPPSV